MKKITNLDQLNEHERRCYELAEFEAAMMPATEMMTLALNLVFHTYVNTPEDEVEQRHSELFSEMKLH